MSFTTGLLAMRLRFADRNVVAILSGGNIDTTVVTRLLTGSPTA
jgi:threonine dehydratase